MSPVALVPDALSRRRREVLRRQVAPMPEHLEDLSDQELIRMTAVAVDEHGESIDAVQQDSRAALRMLRAVLQGQREAKTAQREMAEDVGAIAAALVDTQLTLSTKAAMVPVAKSAAGSASVRTLGGTLVTVAIGWLAADPVEFVKFWSSVFDRVGAGTALVGVGLMLLAIVGRRALRKEGST